MNISGHFIARPVATTLLTLGIALSGVLAFFRLPLAPLPQVSFPTILVSAQMAGASPATMASTVAEPLERHLGAIADVTEMTSQSGVGTTRITMQFGLDRNIDGAARDVQAAIQAARIDLPANLKSNPTYRKFNPADAPIMILALTSKTLSRGQLYDQASNVLQQQISQVSGVGNVDVSGSALPAVRIELQPGPLFKYGIGLEDVRAAIAAANANSPKGYIDQGNQRFQIYTNDQATKAVDYRNLIIAYRKGAPVYLHDVAAIGNSVENLRNAGLFNGKPAVLVIIYAAPGANIIQTIDQITAALPEFRAALPQSINLAVAMNRSQTIRGALSETERTLFLAVLLVVGVVFVFLRSPRATLIPGVAVPISILGTFGPMWLLGYSLDNLSLMALTIATGFVVDDAVVVLENITRHLEAGVPRRVAALRGSQEVSFTVLSMSMSLIAVFLPILLMGGVVGRLFREFAVTLSLAIAVSLVLSLTTTPMMCAYLLRSAAETGAPAAPIRLLEIGFERLRQGYARSLTIVLRHSALVGVIFIATVALNIFLFIVTPKAFFPEQDNGLIIGSIQADQSISFQLMEKKLAQLQGIVQRDPAVQSVAGFTGGRSTSSGFLFIALKPLATGRVSAAQVVARLRRPLSRVSGARLFLVPAQDLRVGGRQSNAEYQFTLQSDSSVDLYAWVPKITAALRKLSELTQVNSDLQQNGLEADLKIDRATASRLGLTPQTIDNTLYDAFGQRAVSTIYNALNQYHVVMELAPQYWQSPQTLKEIWISTSGGKASGVDKTNAPVGTVTATKISSAAASGASGVALVALDSARNQAINSIAASGRGAVSSGAAVSSFVETMAPLSAVARFVRGKTPISVNHQGGFVASTISFNLAPGASLGAAESAIRQSIAKLEVPATIHGDFAGTAAVFTASLKEEPLLIAAAIAAVYIVLGILYESTIHPITILSTLPSAGVGATLALLLLRIPFSIIALIGVILLIGIIKKNAILMIDFAIDAERRDGLSSRDAIYHAAVMRFRPILMTTFAAALGALPLAIGLGEGAELRRPLGVTIVGGLLLSQVLTLYTTPVIYLFLDRIRPLSRPSALASDGRSPGAAA